MHRKTDSEETSLENSTSPHSPSRRPILYYVQSPPQDADAYGSSPISSPTAPQYHSTGSSTTTRFSASLKQPHQNVIGGSGGWKGIDAGGGGKYGLMISGDNVLLEEREDYEDEKKGCGDAAKFYVVCFLFSFCFLFTLFSLILWGVSKSYKPSILVKTMLFENFNVQDGVDHSGVETDLMSLNSTVRLMYWNGGTFFGVHVSATPFDLHYHELQIASGQMEEFYQRRKSGRKVRTVVIGNQVPLYGGIAALGHSRDENNHIIKTEVKMDLNLTFRVRSRADVLGKLVRTKFYRNVRCPVTLDGSRLGIHLYLKNSCVYD